MSFKIEALTTDDLALRYTTSSPSDIGKKDFLQTIKTMQLYFGTSSAKLLENTRGLAYCENEGFRMFGVAQGEDQCDLDFQGVRLAVLQNLNFPANSEIVQFITDSTEGFSDEGVEYCKEFVTAHMQNQSKLVLWGSFNMHMTDHVTSAIRDELVRDRTHSRLTLGIITDTEIQNIAEVMLCPTPLTNNFYLIYNQAHRADARFCADYLSTEAFCFEGSHHSLIHLINLLDRIQPAHVTCIYGLMHENVNIFSAARFARAFVDGAPGNNVCQLSEHEALAIAKSYSERVDRPTREVIEAINLFLERQVWKRLGLCSFISVKSQKQACALI